MMLYESAKERPDYAAEALGHWLDRLCTLAERRAADDPFIHHHNGGAFTPEILSQISKAEPADFLRHVLSRMIALIVKTAEVQKDGRTVDRIWRFRTVDDHHDIRGVLLTLTAQALEHLAQHDPKTFDQLTHDLQAHPHETVAFLLLRAWAASGERYADRAAEYLIADPRRLDIGYHACSRGEAAAAVSRANLAAISPHCSGPLHERLEALIIGYRDSWELSHPRLRGHTELGLLRSLEPARLSHRARLRIEELERKFPNARFDPPKELGVHWVGPPIPPNKTKLMTDEQWLSAMRKYHRESSIAADDFPKGGATELARVLEADAKRDRRRFASLALIMDDGISRVYFSAILDGIVNEDPDDDPETKRPRPAPPPLDAETLAALMRRVHALPGRPCGISICRAIVRTANRELPPDILAIASHYAMHDTHPDHEAWQTLASGGSFFYGGDPRLNGINTVRGAAAGAVAKLQFGNYDRFTALEPAILSLVSDRSLAVRSCAVEPLLPMLNIDSPKAVSLFQKLCEGADAILGTHLVDDFLHYAVWRHYAEVRPVLQHMLTLPDEKAVQTAARQTCVAALEHEVAQADAVAVHAGTEPMRVAAASVYGHNLTNSLVGSKCASILPQFFNDPSDKVREEAATCFSRLSGDDLRTREELVHAFIASDAYEHRWALLHALEEQRSNSRTSSAWRPSVPWR